MDMVTVPVITQQQMQACQMEQQEGMQVGVEMVGVEMVGVGENNKKT